MRGTRLLCCAASVGGSRPTDGIASTVSPPRNGMGSNQSASISRTTKTSPGGTPSSGGPSVMKEDAATPQPFKTFTFQPWHRCCVQPHGAEEGGENLLPSAVLYHGLKLGPRPLLILDHSLRSAETNDGALQQAAKKYEGMLTHLSWPHGAVYVPLCVDVPLGSADIMGRSCKHVCAVMDALDIRWAHVLSYSYGTLVAARMAASSTWPHRIGTLLSLDTPLVSSSIACNASQRMELARAGEDVNVPEAELTFAKEQLLSTLEESLPCPAPQTDQEIYENYLFDPSHVFEHNGLVRKEDRYVPLQSLSEIVHPMQFIIPSKNSITDVPIHKEVFGLRRPAFIKTAARHEDLFALDGGAREVGDVIGAWLNRFEPDEILSRHYSQAAKEMSQLMGSARAESSATVSSTETEKKKLKKEKRKPKDNASP